MSGDDTPTPDPGPSATPAHVNVPTTAMPAHAALATTVQPAHAQFATTALPVAGGADRPAVRSRQASYEAGETIEVGAHRLTIERLLFVGGQAELYVVHGGPAPTAVLKLYTHGARPKADVLDRWRTLPPTAVIALLDADPHCEPRAWELLAFAEGGTLAGAPDTPPVPLRDPGRLRLITQQAAEALHTLHTAGGVVHRDVSPDNFLWLDAARTRLVLSDLGSSSIMSGGAAKSVTIRGKLPFMAPEELLPMGDGVVVGEAADFYALGIMVLTLWAGQHPFVGREADQIALKSRGAVPMPDDLPADFRSLVEALLLPANIRLTYDGIQRWAAGQAIPRAAPVRSVSYPRLAVRPAQGAPYEVDTPAGLARFLRDEPVAGERFLYAWNMREWASSDAGLVADLTDIVEKEFPKNRAAGRQKAAYLLDPTLPFTAPDGAECRDYAELSAWLEGDASRPKGLADPGHPLWLYLATRPENELREAMAEIDADVRQGKPEATALIRHYLMQYAAAGSWRDSDGTVVADISAFIARLQTRAESSFRKLLDPADPLALWLDTHLPGTAVRVGRLRTLDAATIGILVARDWMACALNQVPAILGPPLTEPEDAWREEVWALATGGKVEGVGEFMGGWWRVVEDGRFESAALAWLATRPATGARRQVVTALLANQWEATLQPLSAVLATCFAALPARSRDPADAAVVHAAGNAVAKRLEAIRDSAPEARRALVAVEAAAAFALAAGAARATAPGWWDALLAWIGGQLTTTLRDAFAAYRTAPNVLAELVGRRAELARALAAFRTPALARWTAEDQRREALERELAAAEAKSRDARLRAIGDKAIELRGTPHVQTLTDLAARQGERDRRWFRRGVALLVGVGGLGLVAYFGTDPLTGRLLVPAGGVAATIVSATIAWWVTRKKRWALGGAVLGTTALNFSAPLWRIASLRLTLGLVVIALLGAALRLRWRHVRQVVGKATMEQRQVPPDLAASVRKACDEAEALARSGLAERWLMLHATLATAVDPTQVQLGDIPGGPASAAA